MQCAEITLLCHLFQRQNKMSWKPCVTLFGIIEQLKTQESGQRVLRVSTARDLTICSDDCRGAESRCQTAADIFWSVCAVGQ